VQVSGSYGVETGTSDPRGHNLKKADALASPKQQADVQGSENSQGLV
jgi:hypothetical protein